MHRTLAITLLLGAVAFGQTADPPSIPVGLAVFGAYNQLGTPRWTGGFAAIYPIVSKLRMYGTTTADVYPKLAIDPTTGRKFYAVSASTRQGVHERIFAAGNGMLLVGGDVGPGFSQGDPGGIKISLTSSFVATAVYRISLRFSAVLPVRMLYVSGIGWNPVAQAGVIINLQGLK